MYPVKIIAVFLSGYKLASLNVLTDDLQNVAIDGCILFSVLEVSGSNLGPQTYCGLSSFPSIPTGLENIQNETSASFNILYNYLLVTGHCTGCYLQSLNI
jgi:hypothetical protein